MSIHIECFEWSNGNGAIEFVVCGINNQRASVHNSKQEQELAKQTSAQFITETYSAATCAEEAPAGDELEGQERQPVPSVNHTRKQKI